MTRLPLAAAFLVLAVLPAAAGSPPTSNSRTPESVAASCAALGTRGQGFASGGVTGCINTETGAAITCKTNGQCTDYFADPRWKKIKAIVDAERKKPRQIPL